MKESKDEYIFPCFRHNFVVFRKDNYQRHLTKHYCIEGEVGRNEIEKTLIYPNVITTYTQKDGDGKYKRICQAFYRIIKKKPIGKSKLLLDFWKIIIIKNFIKKRWEIATALMQEDSPEYAMINNRIERVLYPEQKR